MTLIKIFKDERKIVKREKSIYDKYHYEIASFLSLEEAQRESDRLMMRGYGPVLIQAIRSKNEPSKYSVRVGG